MERKAKPYHHGNLKEALLEKGLAALASGRLDELSLRELARDVGVSPNAPYRHFKTKDELLSTLSAQGFARLGVAMKAVSEDGPMKRFRALAAVFDTFAAENGPLFRLMFERSSPSHERDLCFELLSESVRVLMDEVTIDEKVNHATQAAWSLFAGFALLKLNGSFPEGLGTAEAREVGRMLGRGLRD